MDNITILFQGDSITDCGRDRTELAHENKSLGSGYAFITAAKLGLSFPSKYNFINMGIGGNRIVDVYARWKKECINLKPDILSILLGVNDIGFEIYENTGVNAKRFEQIYRFMLDEVKEALPETKIIICEPFVLPVGRYKDDWEVWSAEMKIRQEIIAKIANDYNAVFVPIYAALNEALTLAPAEYWLHDGVHPTAAGHQIIANQWLNACTENGIIDNVYEK